MAEKTVGFCGADLKSLATEACLCCLRRQYPQVYVSRRKLAVDLNYLVVNRLRLLGFLFAHLTTAQLPFSFKILAFVSWYTDVYSHKSFLHPRRWIE